MTPDNFRTLGEQVAKATNEAERRRLLEAMAAAYEMALADGGAILQVLGEVFTHAQLPEPVRALVDATLAVQHPGDVMLEAVRIVRVHTKQSTHGRRH